MYNHSYEIYKKSVEGKDWAFKKGHEGKDWVNEKTKGAYNWWYGEDKNKNDDKKETN